MRLGLYVLLCLGLSACGLGTKAATTSAPATTTTLVLQQDLSPSDVEKGKKVVLTLADLPQGFRLGEQGGVREVSADERRINDCMGYDYTRGNVTAEVDGDELILAGASEDDHYVVRSTVEFKRTAELARVSEAVYISDSYYRCLSDELEASLGDQAEFVTPIVLPQLIHSYGDDVQVTNTAFFAGLSVSDVFNQTALTVRVDRALVTVVATSYGESNERLGVEELKALLDLTRKRAQEQLSTGSPDESRSELPVFTK